jgi:hypothetical protein
MRIALSLTATIIAAAVAAVIAGAAAWQRATDAAVADLLPGAGGVYSSDSLDTLPAPAARYFRRVLRDGQPLVRSTIVGTDAEFFINGAWRPLRATQHFTAAPPQFAWDARIEMMPLVDVRVRDSYIRQQGGMRASLLGLYTLTDQAGTPELNQGALQRFLGEAVWFPTALLPSETVTWTARDDRSARVSIRDGVAEVGLVFEFEPTGVVTIMHADRYKEDNGRYSLQPWTIACDEYEEQEGMLIPLHCEVAWIKDGRAESYWRGRITSVSYRYN